MGNDMLVSLPSSELEVISELGYDFSGVAREVTVALTKATNSVLFVENIVDI